MPTPCKSCPWVVGARAADIPGFTVCMAENLATLPEGRAMACHLSREHDPIPCAGWVLQVVCPAVDQEGFAAVPARLLSLQLGINPTDYWSEGELHPSMEAMSRAIVASFKPVKYGRAWDDVVALARRLGIEVRLQRLTGGIGGMEFFEQPEEAHGAPMWHGWVIPGKEVVVDPTSWDFIQLSPRERGARILHELAHAVCGMVEEDCLGWEVYAAHTLWGSKSIYTRAVVRYQIETIDNDHETAAGRQLGRREGAERRREAARWAREGLPPRLGPVVARG